MNPDGCCVVVSVMRVRRSTMAGCAVIHPRRQPGAIVLENVSRRTTRPSVSRERYDGVRESRKAYPDDVGGCGRLGEESLSYCRFQ